MNSKFYKCCMVPQCTSTSIKTPNKLFIYVPKDKKMRKKWLQLARRDPATVSTKSSCHFCEDHFDLPNDMENYMQYHISGSVPKVITKKGCVPTKFECQPDRRKRTSDTVERSYIIKKRRLTVIDESLKEVDKLTTEHIEQDLVNENFPSGSSDLLNIHENLQDTNKTADKSVQVYMTYTFRSKATQTQTRNVDQAISPLRPSFKTISTSPFKIKCLKKLKSPGISLISGSKNLSSIGDQSDSDISVYKSPVACSESPFSVLSTPMKSSSDCSELVEEHKKEKATKVLQITLNKIKENPRFYIGVPKICYYLIDIIKEETNIPEEHILLCLKKIRLDSKFTELADDFTMTPSYASKIFLKNVPIIASIMRPFIVTLDSKLIKQNLPIAFRHRYYNVSCIIDCLEIETQKPSKAVSQALTWSDYKKSNTIKYLISCTPNGLVNYISPGFGGRVTDTCLVESCDFLQGLRRGMCVLADRGFKHVEQYLRTAGIQLVRPPSVATGGKLTKTEAKATKQIASLRIHIERIIRRVREFSSLRPHACINSNLIKVIDDIIVIACGLINIQDSIIK